MENPWLNIPLADYEAHMSLPNVGQSELLSQVFGSALDQFQPRSVALLGCAGGNGLEQLEGRTLERVVVVDINPRFVEALRARWSPRVPALEPLVCDVEHDESSIAPVDLVFAGLLFEYVNVPVGLRRLRTLLEAGGVLVTVLQLPSGNVPEVTPSPYTSLKTLSSIMRLIDPAQLCNAAATHGLRLIEQKTLHSRGGKQFSLVSFRATECST